MVNLPTIFAIVGPTATGKTNFGLQLAKRIGGVVLSADSRQVYSGMDIGTAKPTAAHHQPVHPTTVPEMIEGVPHFFFNIREPSQLYGLFAWQQEAFWIIDYYASQHVPSILVGGTTLFIDSVAFNYAMPLIPADPNVQSYVTQAPKYTVEWLGLFPGWRPLTRRIRQRITEMIKSGLVEETQQLQQTYGTQLPLLQTINYRQAADVIAGNVPMRKLKDTILKVNMLYARQQMAWWQDNSAIKWYDTDEALKKSHPTFNPYLAAAMTHGVVLPTHSVSARADTSSR
jgi:tRNA dimethylallyltransferase